MSPKSSQAKSSASVTDRKPRKTASLGRPRSEIYVAIAVSFGILLVTVLLVWLLRPGKAGVEGTGGLMTRQPRVVLWLLLSAGAITWGTWWAVNGRHRPKRFSPRVSLAIVAGVIALVAILAAVFWPGGVLRHYKSQPKPVDQTPVTNPVVTTPASVTPTTTKNTPTTKT